MNRINTYVYFSNTPILQVNELNIEQVYDAVDDRIEEGLHDFAVQARK